MKLVLVIFLFTQSFTAYSYIDKPCDKVLADYYNQAKTNFYLQLEITQLEQKIDQFYGIINDRKNKIQRILQTDDFDHPMVDFFLNEVAILDKSILDFIKQKHQLTEQLYCIERLYQSSLTIDLWEVKMQLFNESMSHFRQG